MHFHGETVTGQCIQMDPASLISTSAMALVLLGLIGATIMVTYAQEKLSMSLWPLVTTMLK